MLVFLIANAGDPSLVNPENLGLSGMKRYEKLLSRIEAESRSSDEQKIEDTVDL